MNSCSISCSTIAPTCPLIHRATFYFQSKYHNCSAIRRGVKVSCSQNTTPQQQQQQLNLSVLRFTLGIPGLDESYLPRYIGYAFGALLLLNNFLGSDSSSSIAPAQLRTEALGLSLSAFSALVPYLGQFLKGNAPTQQNIIRKGAEQIFVISGDIEDALREDLAWGSYVLLRNTNSISVLISVEDVLCARGYWNTPEGIRSKEDIADWFGPKIEKIGISFSGLKDSVYFDLTAAARKEQWLRDSCFEHRLRVYC